MMSKVIETHRINDKDEDVEHRSHTGGAKSLWIFVPQFVASVCVICSRLQVIHAAQLWRFAFTN